MKKDEVVVIPFVAHESAMNRMERANKRLWIIILVMFIGIMVYFFLPTEVVKETNTQDVSETTDSEIHQNIGE
jgi:hypothetical protein